MQGTQDVGHQLCPGQSLPKTCVLRTSASSSVHCGSWGQSQTAPMTAGWAYVSLAPENPNGQARPSVPAATCVTPLLLIHTGLGSSGSHGIPKERVL